MMPIWLDVDARHRRGMDRAGTALAKIVRRRRRAAKRRCYTHLEHRAKRMVYATNSPDLRLRRSPSAPKVRSPRPPTSDGYVQGHSAGFMSAAGECAQKADGPVAAQLRSRRPRSSCRPASAECPTMYGYAKSPLRRTARVLGKASAALKPVTLSSHYRCHAACFCRNPHERYPPYPP
jgi:hypothetical protein